MCSEQHPLRAQDGCLHLRSHSDTVPSWRLATPHRRRVYGHKIGGLWEVILFREVHIYGGAAIFKISSRMSFLWVIQYSMKIRHPLGPFLASWVDTYYHYCQEYGENMKLHPHNKQGSWEGRQTKTMWTFLDGWTWVSNFLLSSLSSAKIFSWGQNITTLQQSVTYHISIVRKQLWRKVSH